MFTFWSNAWKNGEVLFEKMFTGIIVVCRYNIFTKLCLLRGGEENIFILCKDFQNHMKVDKSKFPLTSVTSVRMNAVLKITQD